MTPTPQGGLLIEAAVRREGILEYPGPGGSVRREYVPASELGNATLRNAPVTNRHPPGAVTPKNFKTYAVGHVDGEGQAEGDHWIASLVIQADDALGAVETRSAREVSCGYTCDLDETPGVWQGQKYDAVQRNVKFNHVAIVPQGRAGSSVRLRMDSDGGIIVETNPETPQETDQMTPEQIAALQIQLAKATADLAAATSRADTAETSLATEKARADKLEGENKVNKARADAAEKAEQDRKDAAELTDVCAQAAKCVKGFKADGKTVAQVKAEVVAAKFPALKLDAAHLDGAYVAAVSAPDAGAALRVAVSGPATRTDAAPPPDARQRMLDRKKTAHVNASGARLDAAGNLVNSK